MKQQENKQENFSKQEHDSTEKDSSNNRTIGYIVQILTRMNNIRLKRLHEQRMNKLMYQTAFFILVLLSFVLLHAHEQVSSIYDISTDGKDIITCDKIVSLTKENNTTVSNNNDTNAKKEQQEQENNFVNNRDKKQLNYSIFGLIVLVLDIGKDLFVLFLNSCREYMIKNHLAFIFFAGLTGGFLSMVMKLGQGSSNNTIPGDDVYYAWYALTKPVVGALAASILYVIFLADFAPLAIFNPDYISVIRCNPLSAKGFAFGFIMGFSERIIMPQVK
jgi:uncharacterized Tic20 family protein